MFQIPIGMFSTKIGTKANDGEQTEKPKRVRKPKVEEDVEKPKRTRSTKIEADPKPALTKI